MKYRLFIDHARRRATLHAEDCGLSDSRRKKTDNEDEFWSAAHFDSEAAAMAAVLDRLKTADRVSYEFQRHTCTGAVSASGSEYSQ
jgi:hypothetical protein